MTINDKINRVKLLLQNDPQATTEAVTEYLGQAESAVLNAMHPLTPVPTEGAVPSRYEYIQCELAARYFSRRGGLGELEHNENGIGRVWASSTDNDLLGQITPFAKVV